MPAPNHMVAFASKSEISAFDFSTWPNGTPVACLENKSWYFLDKSSSAVADSENVLTSASGRFIKDRATSSFSTAKPSITPLFIGQELTVLLNVGTPTERFLYYIAIGINSSSDWKIVSGSVINAPDTPQFYTFSPEFIGQEWNDNFNGNYYKAVDLGNGLVWSNLGIVVGT